ncbi:MAG TPA: hypothetical protein VGE63_01135 [Candidatus Paceibacterota bacterium]
MTPFSDMFRSLSEIIIPTIVWLAIFLSQDRHREPKSALLVTFIGGMTSYFVIDAITSHIHPVFGSPATELFFYTLLIFFVMFLLIELTQTSLQTLDEPYDYIVYYTTALLGLSLMTHTFSNLMPGSSLLNALPLYVGSISPVVSSLIFVLAGTVFGSLFAHASFAKNPHHEHLLHALGWIGGAAISTVITVLVTSPSSLSTYTVVAISWILFIMVYFLIHGVLQLGSKKVSQRASRKKASTK